MNHYKIDFKYLALAITPAVLRTHLQMAFQTLLLSPVSRLARLFDSYRGETNYRIRHNGQVCHLRAVLNDMFDSIERRIQIEDLIPQRELVVWKRSQNKPIMLGTTIVSKRGFGVSNGYDFVIVCPYELQGKIDETRMSAVCDQYKLASKRYTITYK